MPENDSGDKTERATQRRRRESRNKGTVAMSADVGSATVLLGTLILLWMNGQRNWGVLFETCRSSYTDLLRPDLTIPAASEILTGALLKGAAIVGPVLLGMAVIALAASAAQVGFQLSNEALVPNFKQFDPVAGTKRLFSLRSVATLGTNAAKIAALLVIAYITIRGHVPNFMALTHASVPRITATMSRATLDLGIRSAMLLMVIAAIDYAYQKWQYEKDLRMTKQEVKEERKLLEGSPENKRRIRTAQLAMTRRRMLKDVETADIVLRNPTHYAVALKYDSAKSSAPMVVAKGAGYLALRIIDIARKHNVYTVQDKPLAQALYKTVEVGQEIPAKLYRTVARLLVQLYNLRGRKHTQR